MAPRVEDTRKTGTENSVCLVGRVNLYARIKLEQMVEPACVVAMPMRDRHKVESAQVDAERYSILGKRSRVGASVEQDAFSAKLKQCSEAPVFLQIRSLAERVMENGYSIAGHGWGLTFAATGPTR